MTEMMGARAVKVKVWNRRDYDHDCDYEGHAGDAESQPSQTHDRVEIERGVGCRPHVENIQYIDTSTLYVDFGGLVSRRHGCL